jgi:hypothetical protein
MLLRYALPTHPPSNSSHEILLRYAHTSRTPLTPVTVHHAELLTPIILYGTHALPNPRHATTPQYLNMTHNRPPSYLFPPRELQATAYLPTSTCILIARQIPSISRRPPREAKQRRLSDSVLSFHLISSHLISSPALNRTE